MRPQLTRGEKIIFKERSRIQKIWMSRLPDGTYALYLDGHVQFVSGPDDAAYHKALVTVPGRMVNTTPLRILILGGGDGLAARNALQLPGVEGVVNVEYDPAMVHFARKHPIMRLINLGSFNNPRVLVKVQDARRFVRRPSRKKFNLAILDFPDPTDEFTDLYSQEFYEALVRNHMDPRGFVISAQASDAGGEAERLVGEGLEGATGARPKVIRFKGTWMHNGSIIVVRGGADGKPR